MIKDSERARLDNAYLSAKRLGRHRPVAFVAADMNLPGRQRGENATAANRSQSRKFPAHACTGFAAELPTTRSASQQTLPAQQSRAAASHSSLYPAAKWRGREQTAMWF